MKVTTLEKFKKISMYEKKVLICILGVVITSIFYFALLFSLFLGYININLKVITIGFTFFAIIIVLFVSVCYFYTNYALVLYKIIKEISENDEKKISK